MRYQPLTDLTLAFSRRVISYFLFIKDFAQKLTTQQSSLHDYSLCAKIGLTWSNFNFKAKSHYFVQCIFILPQTLQVYKINKNTCNMCITQTVRIFTFLPNKSHHSVHDWLENPSVHQGVFVHPSLLLHTVSLGWIPQPKLACFVLQNATQHFAPMHGRGEG